MDICLGFYDQFEEIKLSQEWLRTHWPGVDMVNHLVRMSEGLLVFAATVSRFVADEPHAEDALHLFSEDGRQATASSDEEQQPDPAKTPFFDKTYSQILERAAGNAEPRSY